MIEKWLKWNPLQVKVGRYEIMGIIQNKDGLVIVLCDETNAIRVNFDCFIPAFRSCDEGTRIVPIDTEKSNYMDVFMQGWPFYKIENSEFSRWLEKESSGVYASSDIKHFVIITNNSIIDILSEYEPIVGFITEQDL